MVLESDYFNKIEKKMTLLTSWSKAIDTKHFSGTGKYTLTFEMPKNYIQNNLKLELDLGKIGNIAEVHINDKKAGIIWMQGQTCDISNFVQQGKNKLLVLVTNTNINRVSSFKEIQPFSNPLKDKYGKPKTRIELPKEFGFEPLPPSGLLGPVIINPIKKVSIAY